MNNLQTGIDTLKSEILDEILDHLANKGESNTLILSPMWVTDSRTYSRGVRNTLQIRSIYTNDGKTLFGDFSLTNDGIDCGVAFGRSMDSLFLEDLYRILQVILGKSYSIKRHIPIIEKPINRKGKSPDQKAVWKSKLLRKGA